MLILAAPEARAFPEEGRINVAGGAVRLTVSDALTGQVIWPVAGVDPDGTNGLISETGNVYDFALDTDKVLGTPTTYTRRNGAIPATLHMAGRLFVLRFSPVAGSTTLSAAVNIAWNGFPGASITPQFYTPLGLGRGAADTEFRLRDGVIDVTSREADRALRTLPRSPSIPINSNFGSGRWTVPYDLYYACRHPYNSAGKCGGRADTLNQFISYDVSLLPDGRLKPDFGLQSGLEIPAGFPAITWDVADLVVRFPDSGLGAVIGGTLTTRGTMFTASDATQNWSGIRVEDGGNMALGPGSVVERAGAGGSRAGILQTAGGAVTVAAGGRATLDGTTVAGNATTGIYVYGKGGNLAVTGSSLIQNNAGYGVQVAAGASATIDGRTRVQLNGAGGLLATGARLIVHEGDVLNNLGPGVEARYQGSVRMTRQPNPSGRGYAQVQGNHGEISATDGASIITGYFMRCAPGRVCVDYSGGHDVRNNASYFDVQALASAYVYADYNYWGTDVNSPSDLVLVSDGSSTIDISSVLTTPPGFAGRGVAASDFQSPPSAPASAGRGTAVFALIGEAEGLLEAGNEAEAARRIVRAVARVSSDDERMAVSAAAGRLLARTPQPQAMAAVEAAAARSGPWRPWAQQALTVARASAGRTAEAEALAGALISEWPGTTHAAFGHRMIVLMAVEAEDEARALGALSALAGEDDAAAADAAVLVAAAFPDADVEGVFRSTAGRGAAAAVAEAKAGGDAGETRLLVPVPNPVRGAATIRYEVAGTSSVDVAVFDALGRRIAVLHEGLQAAGVHTAPFDTSALPAGVYVVRLTARAERSGERVVGVQRVTVLR